MADKTVIEAIRQYLSLLPPRDIHPRRAVLFGSFARGTEHEHSDIDLVVIAPEFDDGRPHARVRKLWEATVEGDYRIEPVPCGELEWETDDSRPILEIARREGIEIAL